MVVRRSEFESNLLAQIGRRSITSLTIDDIGRVVGDAMAAQRRVFMQQIGNLVRLQQLSSGGAANDEKLKKIHRRLIQIEAEIRSLQRSR
jgi:hypothetical protein